MIVEEQQRRSLAALKGVLVVSPSSPCKRLACGACSDVQAREAEGEESGTFRSLHRARVGCFLLEEEDVGREVRVLF